MTHYPIKIGASNANLQGKDLPTLVKTLAHQGVRQFLATSSSGIANITDNSGGVAATTFVLAPANVALVDTAVNGSNLVTKASFEAALVAIQNALNQLATTANTYASLAGTPTVTYNGGGAAATGTIAAIPALVGGATGPDAVNVNPLLVTYNLAVYEIATVSNKLARALGKATLTAPNTATYVATVPALSTNTGTAVAPGLALTDAQAVITQLENNIATIALHLNGHNDGLIAPMLLPV